jgi:hypothetical protein
MDLPSHQLTALTSPLHLTHYKGVLAIALLDDRPRIAAFEG